MNVVPVHCVLTSRCYLLSGRFGKALFFEYPITNPFAHEERFQINVADPELRLVTAFDEWIHLRRACRYAAVALCAPLLQERG